MGSVLYGPLAAAIGQPAQFDRSIAYNSRKISVQEIGISNDSSQEEN
jgi:hypothetical protein